MKWTFVCASMGTVTYYQDTNRMPMILSLGSRSQNFIWNILVLVSLAVSPTITGSNIAIFFVSCYRSWIVDTNALLQKIAPRHTRNQYYLREFMPFTMLSFFCTSWKHTGNTSLKTERSVQHYSNCIVLMSFWTIPKHKSLNAQIGGNKKKFWGC